ncbi:MAG: helix-turn-helix transcriptional regulator [Acidobacteria bacterium]|nr:helix-turn-helix transcriptional regulator [Acidobacteriota bacterium]
MVRRNQEQELYSGLIRLHILHHAVHEGILGSGIIDELARHGYKVSPATLYPILHRLEGRGYLRSSVKRDGKRIHRMFRATALGRRVLQAARAKVWELFEEIFSKDYDS